MAVYVQLEQWREAIKQALNSGGNKHCAPAARCVAPIVSLDADKRVPFHWKAMPIASSVDASTTKLFWEDIQDILHSNDVSFRITIAVVDWEEKLIEVFLPVTGTVLGQMDIRYGDVLQLFELRFPGYYIDAVRQEGLALRMVKGEKPLWFFSESAANLSTRVFLPHLTASLPPQHTPAVEFIRRMASLSSLQPFSWMEGCIVDGLWELQQLEPELKAEDVIRQHFEMYFTPEGQLIYEDPWSRPADGRLYGIESTLPIAVLAKLDRAHPCVAMAQQFWLSLLNERGGIQDGEELSAEGCYTVAYPMACVANLHADTNLRTLALQQLWLRKEQLWVGDDMYLRSYRGPDTHRTYKNWGRGLAWYLMGWVRTLKKMGGEASDLAQWRGEIERAADIVMSRQRPDGLWTCFIDEPSTGVDTSGSAGIAAALAIGAANGLLPPRAAEAASRTLQALEGYLSADGLLFGASQINKAGEALQRSGYRVYSQIAMGLMLQLIIGLIRCEDDNLYN